MAELDWQEHVEVAREAQATAERQRIEQGLREQQNRQETHQILRVMDLIVVDFLGAAKLQNFPGARPHFTHVPSLLRGSRQAQVGVEYAWHAEGYPPYGDPVFARVHSGGDWTYTQNVDDLSDEYMVSLSCTKKAGQLGASQRSHNGAEKTFVLDASIPEKLMGVLAHIAVENNIKL